MNFLIEQTAEEFSEAAELSANAELLSVRLSRTKARGSVPTTPVTPPMNVNVGQRGGTANRSGELLVMSIEFKYELVDSSSPPNVIASIEVEFEANYKVPADAQYADRAIQVFAGGNLIFNCWSFFREYVQNTAVRMGFPAPPVPLFRFALAPRANAEVEPG